MIVGELYARVSGDTEKPELIEGVIQAEGDYWSPLLTLTKEWDDDANFVAALIAQRNLLLVTPDGVRVRLVTNLLK